MQGKTTDDEQLYSITLIRTGIIKYNYHQRFYGFTVIKSFLQVVKENAFNKHLTVQKHYIWCQVLIEFEKKNMCMTNQPDATILPKVKKKESLKLSNLLSGIAEHED